MNQKYYTDVEHPDPQRPSGNRAAQPDGYVNLGLFVFLMVITLGLYDIYCIYKFSKYANRDLAEPPHSPWAQVFLHLIPFYNYYWVWRTSRRLDRLDYMTSGEPADTKLSNLLLTLFGFKAVASVFLQNSLNKAVGGATGMSPRSTGYGKCKNCGSTFPDDLYQCPNCGVPYRKPFWRRLWFQIVIMVLAVIAAFSVLSYYGGDGAEPSSSQDVTSYSYSYTYSYEHEQPGSSAPAPSRTDTTVAYGEV